MAFDGVTRFEDRYRLPLGVTVNLTDYSAQLATEVSTLPTHVSSQPVLGIACHTCVHGQAAGQQSNSKHLVYICQQGVQARIG